MAQAKAIRLPRAVPFEEIMAMVNAPTAPVSIEPVPSKTEMSPTISAAIHTADLAAELRKAVAL
jgi:hypothetical protein